MTELPLENTKIPMLTVLFDVLDQQIGIEVSENLINKELENYNEEFVNEFMKKTSIMFLSFLKLNFPQIFNDMLIHIHSISENDIKKVSEKSEPH